ncbi:MAG: hypothetical protein PHO03_06370 [Candidatus Omnitrophica bacterium]|nr:hypothetical protein [Candidatus Omnitrophota bacterium]
MDIKKLKIADSVYLLVFDTQYELSSTFLRFQEYYESPKFRGKIFQLKDYKEWYSKLKGGFTYYTDWSGFNIPSYVLEPFYQGEFKRISKKEKVILDMFKKEKSDFYIIGVCLNRKKEKKTVKENQGLEIKNELANGLFYTNKAYKDKVLETIHEFNVNKIKKSINQSAVGYCDEVLDDEVNAYVIGSGLKGIPKSLRSRLENLYKKYLRISHAKSQKCLQLLL